jgi:hypothetical protein
MAKRGVLLQPGHGITITPQSNVMFVQKDGKSMLLDKAGSYTFSQVQSLLQKIKTESVSKNFFAYVFEKFLSGEGDEKQRVAAVVYRGKNVMQSPADSSFVFSAPILQWKPESVAIPYKVEISSATEKMDTIVRKSAALQLPARFITKQAQLISWICYPADSKQKPNPVSFLIPEEKDRIIIQEQIETLRKIYSKNPTLLRLLKQDLFMQWIHTYQLKN